MPRLRIRRGFRRICSVHGTRRYRMAEKPDGHGAGHYSDELKPSPAVPTPDAASPEPYRVISTVYPPEHWRNRLHELPMSPQVALWFIVFSAVIAGGMLTAVSVAAIVRYSRSEEAGLRPKAFPDLVLVCFAFAAILGGMWIAGFFGEAPVTVLAHP